MLLLAIFGAYNLLGVVLLLTSENPLPYEYMAYAFLFCPLILASTVWLLRRHRRGREELGLILGDPRKTLLSGVGGGAVALALSYAAFLALYFLFYLILGKPPTVGETAQLRGTGGGELALILVVTVLLAPVFEEIFFRGLFYSALRRKMGPRVAVPLNGLIFGALHFQPLYMISLVLVGTVLAYLYEKTDSLFASMTAHALYNLVVILVALRVAW
ncbi:MAG: lysostaphin resistance A-like protein [Actinomycetota bacterium]